MQGRLPRWTKRLGLPHYNKITNLKDAVKAASFSNSGKKRIAGYNDAMRKVSIVKKYYKKKS